MKLTYKKAAFAFVLIICCFAASAWYLYNYVALSEFKPVYMGEDQRLEVSTQPMTAEQADRVEAILNKYGEQYYRKDKNTVLITLKLSLDQDLIWNFTTKADVK